jgi:hypothetical protein
LKYDGAETNKRLIHKPPAEQKTNDPTSDEIINE